MGEILFIFKYEKKFGGVLEVLEVLEVLFKRFRKVGTAFPYFLF